MSARSINRTLWRVCGGGVELQDICHITGYESIVINEVIVQVVENTVLFVYRMIFLFNSEHFN